MSWFNKFKYPSYRMGFYQGVDAGMKEIQGELDKYVGTHDPLEIRRMLDQAKDGWRPPTITESRVSLQQVAQRFGVDLQATD